MIREILGYRGLKVFMSYDMHMFLLALLYNITTKTNLVTDITNTILNSILIIATFQLYGLYGFLVNDYYDYEYDLRSGKKRAIHKLSRKFIYIWILLDLIILLIIIIHLGNIYFIIIYIIAIILAYLYSAPPVRFKEKGFLGLIVNCLIEKTLVTSAIFIYFRNFGIDMLIFIILSFSIHFVDIFTHQLYDYYNDSKSNIKTFVVKKGFDYSFKLYKKIICPILLLSVISFVLVINIIYIKIIFLFVCIIYLLTYILIKLNKINRYERIVPLYISAIFFFVHNILPMFLAILLLLYNIYYIALFIGVLMSQYYTIKYKIIYPLIYKKIPHVDVIG